jgi:hypothetical protein
VKTIISSVGFQGPDGTVLANGSLVFAMTPGLYEIISGGRPGCGAKRNRKPGR